MTHSLVMGNMPVNFLHGFLSHFISHPLVSYLFSAFVPYSAILSGLEAFL